MKRKSECVDVEGECGCGAAGVVGMWMWWKQTWVLVDVEMKDVEAGIMSQGYLRFSYYRGGFATE